MAETQTFKNHGRVVPLWHGGVFFCLLANLFWAIYRLIHTGLNGEAIIGLVLALGLMMMFASVRVQILTVQDRVIRLEMRLRLAQMLPPDMQGHIGKLTVQQLIALRFAGDAELTALVSDIAAGKLVDRKDIKMQIKDWQGDYQRA
jgi:Family of unknown function (DUF6526)